MKIIFVSSFLVSMLILTSFGFTEGMGRDTSVITVPESNPSSYMYIYCKRSKQNPYCQRQFSKHFFVHSLMKNEANNNKYDAFSAPDPVVQPLYKTKGLLANVGSVSSNSTAPTAQKPIEEEPIAKSFEKPLDTTSSVIAKTTAEEKPAPKSGKIYIFKADMAKVRAKTEKPEIITVKTSAPKTLKVERAPQAAKAPQTPINSKDYLIKWIKDIYGVDVASLHSEAEIADIYTRLMWCSTIQKELSEKCDYRINSSDELRARYETAKNI